MPTSIQIAPSLEEVKIDGNSIKTSFNNMEIEYKLDESINGVFTDNHLKNSLREAIMLSDRLWLLPYLMNKVGILGKCFVNGNEIDYPKE